MDPSCCLLGNRLQEGEDGSRETYEALAIMQVTDDGGLDQGGSHLEGEK